LPEPWIWTTAITSWGRYASSDSSRVFRLWEYAPGNPGSIVYKGSVATPGSGNANGDIAFDTNGNLFIVRGSGNTTTVYSVTAANLAGGQRRHDCRVAFQLCKQHDR
jgi:hypothetical protein